MLLRFLKSLVQFSNGKSVVLLLGSEEHFLIPARRAEGLQMIPEWLARPKVYQHGCLVPYHDVVWADVAVC